MIYTFVCRKCADGIDKFNTQQYREYCMANAWQVELPLTAQHNSKCPKCGNSDLIRVYDADVISYVRGYGMLDKKAIKNDMNLHLMVTGQDPYKGKRDSVTEDKELTDKLRNNKKFNSQPKNTYL